MKRFLLWFFLILLLLTGGYVVYIKYFKSAPNVNSLALIPQDAIFIIESHEPVMAWKKLSKAPAWQYITTHPYFAEISASANALDSVMLSNDQLFSYFGDRAVYISAHKTRPNDYDFLYTVDLEGAAKIDFLQTILDQVFKLSGWMKNSHDYRRRTISDMLDKSTGEVLHYTIIENQMVLSYNGRLVEKSIETADQPFWPSEPAFKQVSDRISEDGLFRLYISGGMFDDWMACYQQPLDPMSVAVARLIHYGGTSFGLQDDGFSVNGTLNIHDSLDSYLKTMMLNGAGRKSAAAVIPADAALYTGLGFGNFQQFFDELLRMKRNESKDFASYEQKLKFVEKWLGITVKEHFLSWIGPEAAYVVLAPHDSLPTGDIALVIKTKDIEDCKAKLDRVRKRIKRRTPFRIKQREYHGHEINAMASKGLFELMFGNLFSKFEKPFYMFLDDYIIFTNQEATLYKFADDFDQGKTLQKSEGYQKVNGNLPDKFSVFTYMNMKAYLPLTQGKLAEGTYRSLMKNRAYFEAFPYTAFQLIPNETYFELKLNTAFEKPGALPVLDSISSDSLVPASPDVPLLINVEGSDETGRDAEGRLVYKKALGPDGLAEGKYFEYWPDGTVKTKGFYSAGRKSGLWKFYDSLGKFIRKEEPEQEEMNP